MVAPPSRHKCKLPRYGGQFCDDASDANGVCFLGVCTGTQIAPALGMRAFISLGVALLAVLNVSACESGGVSDPSSVSGQDGGKAPTESDCPGMPACAPPLCGATPVPACVNGQWTCPAIGPVKVACDGGVDAANPDAVDGGMDAAIPDAAAADGGIPCGTMTCNSATQFCRVGRSGLGFPDSGVNISSSNYDCPAIPMQCGATPTCACISQFGGCTCGDDGGSLFLSQCVYPR